VNLMTPAHPRWHEFADRLGERVQFETDEGDVPVRWRCFHSHVGCVDVMHAMGVDWADTDATLIWFQAHGGYCDCEVLFNIAALVKDDDEEGES
jgi:hypothetical protein